jgi:hypothetical protein
VAALVEIAAGREVIEEKRTPWLWVNGGLWRKEKIDLQTLMALVAAMMTNGRTWTNICCGRSLKMQVVILRKELNNKTVST